MLNSFLNFFRDPEDKNPSFIRLTRNILLFVLVANAGILITVSGIIPGTFRNVPAMLILSGTFVLSIISFVLVLRGKLGMAKFVVPVSFLVAVGYISITGSGMHDTAVFAFPVVIVISALLLGTRARYTSTPLTVLTVIMIAYADMTGINKSALAERTGLDDIFISGILILVSAEILQLLIRRLNENIQQAQANEQLQIEANRELRDLQTSLEQRIAARTAELEFANQRNEKRAQQFEAIAQVARATTANQNLKTLLPNLANLISQQFGFYHAGIFLIDEKKEFAELRATNSEGGRRMLERGHKLGIGQSGIVGFVSATGKPRIALDVGADAAFFNNPDLPNTHSEMALPLLAGDQTIGVLDIQSIHSNAFQTEDIDVLSTLADQVSIAIQNAHSYETSQELLNEAQRTSSTFLRESWRVLQTQEESLGYHMAKNKLTTLTKPITSAQIRKAMAGKETVMEGGENATLAIPIRLRDQVIGVVDIRVPDEHEWDPDEIDVAEAVAERLSLALEASLLLKSTQRQAQIERITADISTKIGATTQFDSILRTAAEELSRVLGGSEVLVQIQSSDTPNDAN
jgi:GAF domain-containing protein